MQANFANFCSEASIPQSRRQLSKFQKSTGMAFHAKKLRLVEKHKTVMESSSEVRRQTSDVEFAISHRHELGFKNGTGTVTRKAWIVECTSLP